VNMSDLGESIELIKEAIDENKVISFKHADDPEGSKVRKAEPLFMGRASIGNNLVLLFQISGETKSNKNYDRCASPIIAKMIGIEKSSDTFDRKIRSRDNMGEGGFNINRPFGKTPVSDLYPQNIPFRDR